MANRILVNSANSDYRRITQNGAGPAFGLGIRDVITPDIQNIIRSGEIYFTRQELENKRRKLKITLDTYTTIQIFAAIVNREALDRNTDIARIIRETIEGMTAQFNEDLAAEKSEASRTNGRLYLPENLSVRSICGTLESLDTTGDIIKKNGDRRWLFTGRDFVAVSDRARAESPLRAIHNIYDDESEIYGLDIGTSANIVLLAREALADSLFAISGIDVATPGPDHPGPRGNGTADRSIFGSKNSWLDKDALYNHFRTITELSSIYKTHARVIVNILKYINLIDTILNLQDSTLSRAVDITRARVSVPINIRLTTAQIGLFSVVKNAMIQTTSEKLYTFLDENREYKTILNFGDDKQYLVESWRKAPGKNNTIQLKLFSPLQSTVELFDRAFISREIAKTIIDRFEFELGPARDTTPYLRPYNSNALLYAPNKRLINNVTMNSLGLSTAVSGSIVDGKISYGDITFRRWFTDGFNASELNIDFSDYKNFVHFGSAYQRLLAFSNKLKKLEELSTFTTATTASSNIGASLKAIQKENIIRAFDPYEQFLYYNTESAAYSASAYYADSGVEYNITGSWPKDANGLVYSTTSSIAINWYASQSAIAERYDLFNENYLVKHLPSYVQEDTNSNDFTVFVAMVGHMADNVKVYIDQFPNIYSTNPDPFKDLSMDQVYEVAQSFGLQLPNAYSLQNLQNFVASLPGDDGTRATVSEIWKRFLHSMVYLNKIKGSRTSFDALLNTYGLSAPIIQIKETTYPFDGNYVKSDELTYGLAFESASNNYIAIPFYSSSVSASSVQIRFNPDARISSSLATFGSGWAIDLIPHPSGSDVQDIEMRTSPTQIKTIVKSNKQLYGKIHIVSGSGRTILASSSYFPLFSGDYTNIMLRSASQDMVIVQTDGEQILYKESASVNLSNLWNISQTMYVGASGSIKLDNFDGKIDEIKVWGEAISVDAFLTQAMDPGAYYGSSYSSSYQNLYVHIPFNQPLTSITQSVLNESPYVSSSAVGLTNFTANGFTTESYTRLSRTVTQFTPIIGTTTYSNNKIRIAPPPVFKESFVDDNGTITLQRNVSIKPIEEKKYTAGLNVVSVGVSPTDFVNQTITRTMGNINVNKIIGSPKYASEYSYTNLEQIKNAYLKYYNKTIDVNEFTRFFTDLTEAAGEMASMTAPAKAKVLDGIVIESPMLIRNKSRMFKKFTVSGQDTRLLDEYLSGSATSEDVGAYTGLAVYDVHANRTISSDISLMSGSIYIGTTTQIKSSTAPSKIPAGRLAYQYMNSYDNQSLVTSSLNDEYSSFAYIETNAISLKPISEFSSSFSSQSGYAIGVYGKAKPSGYPRDPYIQYDTRFTEENNTLVPLYDIPPRCDFNDVGTTTYFYRADGIYSYAVTTNYKKPYLVKFQTTVDSSLNRLFAPLTLLDPTTLPNTPSRDTATISVKVYGSGSLNNTGVLKAANTFALYGVEGTAGLRVRLYRTADALTFDAGRSFSTAPSINSGVLFDAVLDGNSDVYPATLIQTVDSNIYYSIDNTTGTEIISSINLQYFAYEPVDLIPSGYLPRHYKFSRDNGIAIKRRNILGTKYTDETPAFGCPDDWDDCPPFQAKSTETNQMTVTAGQNSLTNPLTFVG